MFGNIGRRNLAVDSGKLAARLIPARFPGAAAALLPVVGSETVPQLAYRIPRDVLAERLADRLQILVS